ncbi:aspartyl protease family protein [Flavobacterium psychrotolerans]|uniref:Signal protein PDZ n=1 Tax=Flavobacterium psychrotolerans TaxID=2169410 RepID=A0A2U1JL81_9FLAO|nr:aspartyl protease family protein [Flavobacterium psychrotolerans]PWA05931.1 signal protein PDZ [Flavobacterium psychrotolerans]
MKIRFIFFIVFTFWQFAFSQQGFQLDTNKKKIQIPFQLINNLIFIPINVNGVELNFLLDTGVEETILLSLDDKEGLNLNNVEKIKLRGLGNEESVEGLKSKNNILSSNGFTDRHHDLYIVLDQSFNFSTHIGIPVNGIIGYSFFKNNLIEIDYDRKKIIIYNENDKILKKINKKYVQIPISIERNKPYTQALVTIAEKEISAKLLLDLGNSDALWLFQDTNAAFQIPEKSFDDFLGKGFSGDVLGKRTRISKFKIDKFEFQNPIIAMPDSNSIKSVTMVKNRAGSIGGEIFKRFSIIFNYKNNQLFLRKSNHFDAPFQYNMSGIELQNEGMQWVQETVPLQTVAINDNTFDENGNKINSNFKYKFSLKPVYTIANIRKDSPAELCGLKKGDILIKINNSPGYKYSLQGINEILKSEEGKWMDFEIERNGRILKFKFQLKSIL